MTKESNREAAVEFLCKSFTLSPQEFEAVNREKRKAVASGKKDLDFWLEYAKQKNISLPKDWESSWNRVMKEAIGINHDMYDLVLALKGKGIPIALLSNIDDRLARIIRDFNLYAPFDPCFLSCEIGLEKPDPKIYEFLLKEMDLPAASIVFISQNQLQKELKKRGLFS